MTNETFISARKQKIENFGSSSISKVVEFILNSGKKIFNNM